MQTTNLSVANGTRPISTLSWVERHLVPVIYRRIGPAPVKISLGGGPGISPPGVVPRFHVAIRDLPTLFGLILDPELAFGDGWTDGRIGIQGNLPAFLETVYDVMYASRKVDGWFSRLISHWIGTGQANTVEGSRRNIHSHYDIGNAFYRLWLDREMVYTCAYFTSPSSSLEHAQKAKMEHICRKLRLQPGERVVESGCGWGALAIHMARHHGVRVRAFNISREQILYARRRAADEGLIDRVEFIEDDYRNASGRFDAFVSIGMLEHAGRENYNQLGAIVHRLIGDQGRGLLHFIGRNGHGEFSRWIRRRIFPGAYAPALSEALSVLEPFGYFVQDVENLRPHYARTLEHWLDRFDRSADKVREMYDEHFERAWRLYLAGSIAGFRTGTLQLFQILFSGSKCASLPPTRNDLYRSTTD